MLKDDLEAEIKKWTKKLDEKLPKINHKNDSGKWILENIHAYRQDSEHFKKNGDLIKSYEALIWAWAFLEIGEELNHLTKPED